MHERTLLVAISRSGETADLLTSVASHMAALTTPEYLERVEALAKRLAESGDIYILGRGINYPVALEAAIKVQEVSYIHAEGLAGGELKHYAIALIGPGTPCVILCSNDEMRAEILSNAAQVRARGGMIIGVGPENNALFDEYLVWSHLGLLCLDIIGVAPGRLLGGHRRRVVPETGSSAAPSPL
jgi:glucosamine--fructose-6-phosphate aminotransferase (isomerizing)